MATDRAKWLINELAKEAEARLKGDMTKGYTYEAEAGLKVDINKGYTYEPNPVPKQISIKNVIFNPPATIVLWTDGTKTVVKCGEHDMFDPEKGLAMAIAKKAMGNKGSYFNDIKKWTEPWYEEQEKKLAEEEGDAVVNALKRISEQAIQIGKAIKNCNIHIEEPVVEKTCGTCKYGANPPCEEPCVDCAMDRHTLDPSRWEPKDTCQ